MPRLSNIDQQTVDSFGDEWARFDQSRMSDDEAHERFREYFAVFPWDTLPPDAEGFDMGCGTGRWSRLVAPKVGKLHCIDPSKAIWIARGNLVDHINVCFHHAAVDSQCLPPSSQDFGYSLGVLHHVPDTAAAVRACVRLLKPGAPFLVYLYYAFDGRPLWFRTIWKVSNIARQLICRLPPSAKNIVSELIAVVAYLPLALTSRWLERLGFNVDSVPLSYYRKYSFYSMRTDARDRFGTPLERRFSKTEISDMMKEAGLENVRFSDSAPFWCVVGNKGRSCVDSGVS